MNKEAMKLVLEAAYLAGWNASGEGYNSEYPFGDHARNPEEDAAWIKDRDNALRKALAEQPAIKQDLTPEQPAQPQQEPVADEVRCPECGYLTKHTEHIGCLRKQLNAINAFEQRNFAIVNMDKFPPAQQINQETRIKNGLKYSPNYVAGYNDGLKAALAEQPAQQEPGRNHWEDGDVFERIGAMKKQPAQPQQEPVAWLIAYEVCCGRKNRGSSLKKFDEVWAKCSFVSEDKDAEINASKWRNRKETALYTSPPAQQQEPQPPYEFERYVAGSLRAQGVRVERATTLADAMRIAAKICPPANPPSAPTVLVYTSPPAQRKPLTAEQRLTLFIELNKPCVQVSGPSEMFDIIVRAIEAAHQIGVKK